MDEPGPNLEEVLFQAALEQSTPAAMATFLDGLCRGQPALRARLEILLEGHFGAAGFLNGPLNRGTPQAPRGGPMPPSEEPAPPPAIHRYKILEKIGEGGFGEVWMAHQQEPVKRRVAVKIIKPGMDSRQVIARFEAERQALAIMDHASIARVLDAGMTEGGRPYFAMELVRGIKITDYCDRNALPTLERLKLFGQVCSAIQHAHQKGIIHRDIKPSNILVTLIEGEPVPKVIDFGIAKATQGELTDKTVFTQFQHFIGTPAYISPEQAQLSSVDVDTRSDIYSLGVLLYELLVGQTPFDATEMVREGLDSLRRIIREKEPVKPSSKLRTLSAEAQTTTAQLRQTDPSRLTHLVSGDLDWIVMKCLEKDRRRRYQTANGVAMDIKRYLAQEPILARPPTAFYGFQKWLKRNALAVAAATLAFAAAVVGVGAFILIQQKANMNYRSQLYVSEIGLAATAWRSGLVPQMLEFLDRCPPESRHWEWKFLQTQTDGWKMSVILTDTNLVEAVLSPDQKSLVIATREEFRVMDFPSGRPRLSLPGPGLISWKDSMAISPAGDRLAILSSGESTIRIRNLSSDGPEIRLLHEGAASGLAWGPDGRLLASAGDGKDVRLWDPGSGRLLATISTPTTARALDFSPDGKTLALGTEDAEVRLWDVSRGQWKRTLQTTRGRIHRLKFSPDSQRLAVDSLIIGSLRSSSHVWHLGDGESLDLKCFGASPSFDFSPDGHQLLAGDEAGIVRLWDLRQKIEIDRVSAHLGSCRLVRHLTDGRILSVGAEGAVKIWEATPTHIVHLAGHDKPLRTLSFSPDGRWLAAAGIENKVLAWDFQHGAHAKIYTNHLAEAPAVACSRDGRVATADEDKTVHVWNPASLTTYWTQSLAPANEAWWLAFSPDQKRLYAASANGTITVLDAANGERLTSITGFSKPTDGIGLSPNGELMAVVQKNLLSVWKADGSREIWQASAALNRCVVFSPDGRWIATGGQDKMIGLWEVSSAGRVRQNLRGHAAPVTGVAYSPDGLRLASSSMDGVRVWDPKSGAELLHLPVPGEGAWHVAFSPDGRSIAAAGGDGIVTIWQTD